MEGGKEAESEVKWRCTEMSKEYGCGTVATIPSGSVRECEANRT